MSDHPHPRQQVTPIEHLAGSWRQIQMDQHTDHDDSEDLPLKEPWASLRFMIVGESQPIQTGQHVKGLGLNQQQPFHPGDLPCAPLSDGQISWTTPLSPCKKTNLRNIFQKDESSFLYISKIHSSTPGPAFPYCNAALAFLSTS